MEVNGCKQRAPGMGDVTLVIAHSRMQVFPGVFSLLLLLQWPCPLGTGLLVHGHCFTIHVFLADLNSLFHSTPVTHLSPVNLCFKNVQILRFDHPS